MPSVFPFAVCVPSFALGGASAVRIEVETASADVRAAGEVRDVVDRLVRIAALGAFAVPSRGSGTPRAAWLSRGAIGPRGWWGELALEHVNAAFWRALAQVLVQCHYYMTPITALHVTAPGHTPATPLVDPSSLLAIPYARRPDDEVAATTRRTTAERIDTLRLRLTGSAAETAVDGVRSAIEDWATIVYLGAYADGADAGTKSETFVLGDVSVAAVGDDLVVVSLDDWGLPPDAVDGLLAVVAGLRRAGLPIADVTLA